VKHKSRIGVGVGWPGWGAEGDRNRKKENPKLLVSTVQLLGMFDGLLHRILSCRRHLKPKVHVTNTSLGRTYNITRAHTAGTFRGIAGMIQEKCKCVVGFGVNKGKRKPIP